MVMLSQCLPVHIVKRLMVLRKRVAGGYDRQMPTRWALIERSLAAQAGVP